MGGNNSIKNRRGKVEPCHGGFFILAVRPPSTAVAGQVGDGRWNSQKQKIKLVFFTTEASHRGLVRALGKRVYRKVSSVRIAPPPPDWQL